LKKIWWCESRLIKTAAGSRDPKTAMPVGSVPVRQDLLGLHHLVGGTGKTKPQFPSSASDLDLDGVQAAAFHSEAELFVNFPDPMLSKAIAHG